MARHGGHRESKNSKQETDQIVLTITKALTKRLIVILKPKSGGAGPKKIFSGALRRIDAPHFCAGPVPPTFKFVPAPLMTLMCTGVPRGEGYGCSNSLPPIKSSKYLCLHKNASKLFSYSLNPKFSTGKRLKIVH